MSQRQKSTAAWSTLKDGTRIAMNRQARKEAKALIKRGEKVLIAKQNPLYKAAPQKD